MVLLDMLEQQQEEENTNKVNLMTLHAAKGLEFDYVYIIGCEEKLLPHVNSIMSANIEEERRLMYVGITRAKSELTLLLCKQRRSGADFKAVTPSRFLDELPAEYLSGGVTKKEDPKKVAENYLANIQAMLAAKKK